MICDVECKCNQWLIWRGRAGSPPPLDDGLTPSLTVFLICDKGTILWRHHRHFYLFKHVKHGTQNIQNDCHQWLCDSLRVHQFRFRPRLHPGPRWGSLQRSPDSLAGLRMTTSKGEGKGKGRGKKGREGRDAPPFRKFLDPPR